MFIEYFNNPMFTKIKNIDTEYSLYMCKLYCLLSREFRYIIVIVKLDLLPIKTEQKLSNLKWISLQARTLKESYDLPLYTYDRYMKGPLFSTVNMIENNDEYCTYKSDEFPLLITLMYTPDKKTYNKTGTLVSCLETFETIIMFSN